MLPAVLSANTGTCWHLGACRPVNGFVHRAGVVNWPFMWGSGCVCSGSLSAIRSSACGPDCLLIPSSKVWSWTNKRAHPPPQPVLSTSSSLGSTSSFLYFSRVPKVSLSDPTMREARETFLLWGILTNKYFPHNINHTPYFTPTVPGPWGEPGLAPQCQSSLPGQCSSGGWP